ncbi:MAG: hypothetical protein K8L99_27055 [Anaerolineae bacterium]|nr:hypothetical protein [Anaerolineae bacterium]
MAHQSLLYPPSSLQKLARGIDQITHLMAATLGPNQGFILNQTGPGKPEQLTDSGVIARRLTELPVPAEDVGAMLVRGMAQQMHDRYQDGAATACVLAGSMVREATKMVVAGNNPMLLRRGMALAVEAANGALAHQCQMPQGQKMLKQIAMATIGDEELSDVLGEMFDVLGKYGAYMVEEYAAPHIDRDYIDGGRWRARPGSRQLMPANGVEQSLNNILVMVTDDQLDTFNKVRPALELAMRAPNKPPLLIITRGISGDALQALNLNVLQGKLNVAVAVSTVPTPRILEELEDMALLTGATVLSQATGRGPEHVRPNDLGRARQMRLDSDSLTLVGGAGDKTQMQRRAVELQNRLRRLDKPDEEWERLRLRVARLTGGLCILKVGAFTFKDRERLKELAKKAVRVLELALEEGVVPGGGAAYIDCIPAVLAARDQCATPDEAYGVQVVARALETPLRQIVANHGEIHPPLAVSEVQARGAGYGFDAMTGTYRPMIEAGILDSRAVVQGALEAAYSAAAMAITTDVIVLHGR